MKIGILIKTLVICKLIQIGFAENTFYRWQCSLLFTNDTTIRSLVEQNSEAFQTIGWPDWMISKLDFINCAERGLKNVPQGLNSNVQILDLGRNSITHIRKNDFATYQNLVAISLIKNCMISDFYAAKLRRCSTYVTAQKGALSNLPRLKYLALSSNSMKQLPEMLPSSIRILMASFASLSPIQKKDLKQLTALELVSFSTNCIMGDVKHYCARRFTISEPVFSSPNLKFLDLAYNNFTLIPSYLFQQSLVGIKLRGNPLNWVRSSDFVNATNITYLNVGWTCQYIKTPLQIEKGSFDMLRKLEVLDLSANMISSLPINLLSSNTRLKALNLEFNCLKMIEVNPAILPAFSLLEELSLGGNTFCSDTLNPVKHFQPRLGFTEAYLRFPNLTILSLGKLKDSPTSKFISSFLYMHLLYGTKYDCVDGDSLKVFRNLTKLRYLDMIACGIRELNTTAFSGLKFEHLDLQMNQIGEEPKNGSSTNRLKRHDSYPKTPNEILNILEVKAPTIQAIYDSLFHKVFIETTNNQANALVIFSRNSISSLQSHPLKHFSFATHLDLSYNQIKYIREDAFHNLTMLRILDLRHNPVRNIHSRALMPLVQISNLLLDLTENHQEFSIEFLLGAHRDLSLNYSDTNYFIYSLLQFYANKSVNFSKIISLDLSNIKVPHYFISNNFPLYKPLTNLLALNINGAQITFQPQSNFFIGVSRLQHLSMRECWLEEFPYLALHPLQKLKYLDLSYNQIEVLNTPLNANFPSLETLILSHNYIFKVVSETLQRFLNIGMRKIDLSFNQIKNINPSIINRDVIQEMDLDLRGNAVSCDCSLSDTFGWLIQSNKLNNSKLPGFLPFCSSSVQNYHGGCIACDQSTSDKPLSLFTYTITNNCRQLFLIRLVAWFNCIVMLFLTVALAFKTLKRKLLSFALRGVLLHSTPNPPSSSMYAYDGFVFYDRNNAIVGDWVDNTLVNHLENGSLSFRISVVGKEDWCGMTQVQQLLLRMRASRKTIVIISADFLSNPQCQYVLSVLEEWIYISKEDKCILIAFDIDETNIFVSKLYRKSPSRNPYSMLKYSLSEDALFWDLLTKAMTSFMNW